MHTSRLVFNLQAVTCLNGIIPPNITAATEQVFSKMFDKLGGEICYG
jgi:hypothetical protein